MGNILEINNVIQGIESVGLRKTIKTSPSVSYCQAAGFDIGHLREFLYQVFKELKRLLKGGKTKKKETGLGFALLLLLFLNNLKLF